MLRSDYVNDPETSEDIVQETFLKIWKNRKTIDIRLSFRNFLLTSVRNSCTDYLRKESITTKYTTDQVELPSVSMSPEDFYTLSELETLLRQALEKLSSDVREVFEMNRFNGLTYREIATRLELSPKTIEARMSKALKTLRHELKDYFPLLLLLCTHIDAMGNLSPG
ncbi:RNA polymerase sigma-70 factor [Tannerella forsythia]|uniref:RNA polymerase sigma-70 factor n=1 Tax=Tannerella forsythia TaxID=28112 RepID=UPI00211C7B6C|nr:RNA polymerase sigma-70 factor [Tannerella forsythia]